MKFDTRFRKFVLTPLLAVAGISVAASLGAFYSDAVAKAAPHKAAPPKPHRTGVLAQAAPYTFPPISYQLPADIPGGAGSATITQAATFAWQEFIALNWPAAPTGVVGSGTRGAPDTTQKFGADSSGPNQASQFVVWETYRGKVETFPGVGNPPGYVNNASVDYGFDAGPQYVYGPRSTDSNGYQQNPGGTPINVPACQNPAQAPVATPSYVNLDEITQIGVDSMFAGILPASVSGPSAGNANAQPQLIRFLAKGNRNFYDYVAANQYWYQGQAFATAQQNFAKAAVSNIYPAQSPNIVLPPGTVLAKAAWRPLAPGESAANFHTKTVRFYDQNGGAATPCYREQTWALIALHIIQKTPSAPYFIFATFEYTSNILNPNGSPVEDNNGAQINAPPGDGMDPAVTYYAPSKTAYTQYNPANPKGVNVGPVPPSPPNLPVPLVLPGRPYCQVAENALPPATNLRLYYQELNADTSAPVPPANNGICVNKRYFAIPTAIQQVNAAAHAALQAYGAPPLWQNYKLVNVQWQPFNMAAIDTTGGNTARLVSTYSLANSVVETDNSLQQFFGGLFAPGDTFFKSALEIDPVSGTAIPSMPAYNIYLPPSGTVPPAQFTRTLMGGCMGCHGRAQKTGTDFSFTLGGGPVATPEFAVPATPPPTLEALGGTAPVPADVTAGFDRERLKKLHRALAGY